MNTNIYALIDPRTNKIRYIGKANNPKERLRLHLQPTNLKYFTYKNNWIKSLLKLGLKPLLRILEIVSIKEWKEKESYYIKFYKKYGLANSTDGGDGLANPNNLTKAKISKALKDNKHGAGHKSWLNKSFTEEHKLHISKRHLNSKVYKNNKSTYKGVSWCENRTKWISVINYHKKRFHLGYFNTKEEAAKVYNERAKQLLETTV